MLQNNMPQVDNGNYTTNSQFLGKNNQNSGDLITPRLERASGQWLTIDTIRSLTQDEIISATSPSFLVENSFIARGAITGIYAKAGTGKTFLNLAIIQHLLIKHGELIITLFDADNTLATLRDRGIHYLMASYNQERERLAIKDIDNLPRAKLLNALSQGHQQRGDNLSNQVFIFDTARDFIGGELNSDTAVDNSFFKPLKALRKLGATIIYYHHTTKGKGKDLDGDFVCKNSGAFADHSDYLLELARTDDGRSDIATMTLRVTPYGKARGFFAPIAFNLPITDNAMADALATTLPQDNSKPSVLTLTEYKGDNAHRTDLVEQIHAILLKHGAMTATQIAAAMGKDPSYATKTLKPILAQWLGVRWIAKKRQDTTGRMRDFYELPPQKTPQE